MERSIGIIGAGIAGLSAGCYARMNDYRTVIFEAGKTPGGLCTSWKRGSYTVDACIHWLCGSNPQSQMRTWWEELGALQGKTVVDHEVFTQVERGNRVLKVFCDLPLYERHLLELSPQDAPLIRKYITACRKLAFLDRVPSGTGFFRKWLGIAAGILTVLKYARMPQERFAARFRDPFLRESILNGFSGLPDCPLLALLFTHALLHNKNAGYPVGGSLEFSRSIERRFLALGGEVRYASKVVKVLVTDGRAEGVKLEDGREERFDRVISAADGHTTLYGMLGEEYVDPAFRRMYEKWTPFPPLFYLSFGVAKDLSGEPHSLELNFSEPLQAAGNRIERVHVRHFCYDPSMAPPGRSVVVVLFPTTYEYWRDLKGKDPEAYRLEKERIAQEVLKRLEVRFPGLSAAVEMTDVATPTTFEQYTGNWRGSFEGWLPTTKNMMARVPTTLKKVRGFHMIGQWVRPGGGLPPALMSGRDVIRRFCREDGLKFTSSKP